MTERLRKMMSLFRNRICWRLRRTGRLAWYADGAPSLLAAPDRAAVEAHLAACPACAAEVAERRAVASLLRGNSPSAAEGGLAARGELWRVLEARIAATPQDSPPSALSRQSSGPPPPSPGLERLAHILSTPRGAPFGAAVAVGAAVVAAFVFLHHPASESAAQVASATVVSAPAGSALISITPYPILPAPVVPHAAAAASRSAQIHARRVPAAAVAAAAMTGRGALRPKPAAALSARPVEQQTAAAAHRSPYAGPRPTAAAPLLVADASSVAGTGASSAAAMFRGSTPPIRRMNRLRKQEHPTTQPAPAPTPSPAPTPFAVAAGAAPGFFGASTVTDDGTPSGTAATSPEAASALAADDAARADVSVPDARATVDVALELRRQRSLFSYATR